MKPCFVISGSSSLSRGSSDKENYAPGNNNSSSYFSNPSNEKKSVVMRPTFEKAFSMITKHSEPPFRHPPAREVKKYRGMGEIHDFRSDQFAPSDTFKSDCFLPVSTPFDYSHEPQRKSTRSQKSMHRQSLFNREEQDEERSEVKRHLFTDDQPYLHPYNSEKSVSTETTSQHRSSFKTQAESEDEASFLSRLDQDTLERPYPQFKKGSQPKTSLRLAQLIKTRNQLHDTLHDLYEECMYEPRLLPTLEKQKSYAEVTTHTVAQILGNTSDVRLLIIDCRFSYEYDGGHIKSALNINDPFTLENLLLNCADAFQRVKHRVAIVLHCEFSSKRGPALYSMIRELDRKLCLEHYPMLLLPQLYVMKGGYSQFYAQYPQLCDGEYTTMEEGTGFDNRDTLSHFNQEQNKYRSELKLMF